MSEQSRIRTGADRVVLDVKALKKHFPIEKGLFRRVVGHVKAVDGVSFTITAGETVGLVGESGCGKTTLGRCVLRAIEPTDGRIVYTDPDGASVDITALDPEALRSVRKRMQMIFQDPYSSLDPRMTVLDLVGEPLRGYRIAEGREREERVKDAVRRVGLEVTHLKRYPHAFSGGQRQRIGIARALSTNPDLIVADEPVSALDVSVRAQILNLLLDLQEELSLTYLFVSHDLSVVRHIADRVAVMYCGELVELGSTRAVFDTPQHPYTEALMSAVPKPDPDILMDRIILPGEVANPADPPSGCPFHPRCGYAQDVCVTDKPPLRALPDGRLAACHFSEELDLKGLAEIRAERGERPAEHQPSGPTPLPRETAANDGAEQAGGDHEGGGVP